MTRPQTGHGPGGPRRRLRRWARSTPNGQIALTLILLGVTLLVVAAGVAVVLL